MWLIILFVKLDWTTIHAWCKHFWPKCSFLNSSHFTSAFFVPLSKHHSTYSPACLNIFYNHVTIPQLAVLITFSLSHVKGKKKYQIVLINASGMCVHISVYFQRTCPCQTLLCTVAFCPFSELCISFLLAASVARDVENSLSETISNSRFLWLKYWLKLQLKVVKESSSQLEPSFFFTSLQKYPSKVSSS